MEIRKSVITDCNEIMRIIQQAQSFLKDQGVDQWQDNYPNNETIKKDIQNDISYVLIKDNNIVGTMALSFEGEKTYDTIYEGQWLTNDTFGVVHRVAVDTNLKRLGLSSFIMKQAEEICLEKGVKSIKIDTHENNIPMQNFLKKNNFKYCGVIYLENGSKRVAFEKVL